MLLPILIGIAGAAAIAIAIFRFGFASYKSVISPPGILCILGVGLITTSIVYGVIQSNHAAERVKFDAAIVKIFGHAPEKLDVEGDQMSNFHGTAVCDGKKYLISTTIYSMSNAGTQWQITAAPVDK